MRADLKRIKLLQRGFAEHHGAQFIHPVIADDYPALWTAEACDHANDPFEVHRTNLHHLIVPIQGEQTIQIVGYCEKCKQIYLEGEGLEALETSFMIAFDDQMCELATHPPSY